MNMTPLHIFIAFVGIWRLCSLAAHEEGPFHMFVHLRDYARHLSEVNRFWRAFHLYDGLRCEWCVSVWLTIPFTVLWVVYGDAMLYIILPFTLSALVIAFKYVIHTLEQVCSYFENLNKQFKRGD